MPAAPNPPGPSPAGPHSAGPWDTHQLVFVGGMHRSGTTLLADRLAALPGVAGLAGTGVQMNEGQFLQDVYPIGKVMGGVTRWARDPRAHLDAAAADRTPDAAARLWAAWRPYWDADAELLVEKTPLNLTKLPFLQRVFPRSRHVVITRHPVAQALAVAKWSPRRAERYGVGLPALVEHWVLAHESFAAAAPGLAQLHVVRFEHLVAEPAAEAARLGAFLDRPVPADLLAGYDPARAHVYTRRWGSSLAPGAARARAVVAVRTRRRSAALEFTEAVLHPRQAARIRRRFGARIAALGYDVDVLDDARPWSL